LIESAHINAFKDVKKKMIINELDKLHLVLRVGDYLNLHPFFVAAL